MHIVSLVMTSALIACSVASGQSIQKTQNFDQDPHWDAVNNWIETAPVRVTQDFGYSKTNHAGGEQPGEVGGSIWRSVRPAIYGVKLPASKTLDQPIHSSGKF